MSKNTIEFGENGKYIPENNPLYNEIHRINNNPSTTDYIVDKKYRLLELHPEDKGWLNLLSKRSVLEFVKKPYNGVLEFKTSLYDCIQILNLDGYPIMELVEEESIKECTNIKYWGGLQHLNPVPKPRTFKKHYRFKLREYRHGKVLGRF